MDSANELTNRTKPVSEPPGSPVDRVFQFISDPKHKENLSGRVRAACITCRRKKIKCSGEINCQTCREKGLVCEGLPDRKRPKRDSFDSSIILDPLPAGVNQIRRLSAPANKSSSSPKQRPGSLLRLSDLAKSNDSGYGTSSSPAAASFPRTLMETSPLHSEGPNRAERTSPTPFRVDIWDSTGQQPSPQVQNAPELGIEAPELSQQRRASQLGPQKPSLIERNSSQDEISWWNKPHHLISPQTTDLSTAAQIVFGTSPHPSSKQTNNLPSTRQGHIDLDGMPFFDRASTKREEEPSSSSTSTSTTRTATTTATTAMNGNQRQTIHLPLSELSSASQHFNDNHHNNNPILPNHQPGIFDDMALLVSSLAPPTNGAHTNELSSWWDINSDLTNMLSQAENILKEEPEGGGGGGELLTGLGLLPPPASQEEQQHPLHQSSSNEGNFEIPAGAMKMSERQSPPNPRKVNAAVGGFYW